MSDSCFHSGTAGPDADTPDLADWLRLDVEDGRRLIVCPPCRAVLDDASATVQKCARCMRLTPSKPAHGWVVLITRGTLRDPGGVGMVCPDCATDEERAGPDIIVDGREA